MGIWWSEANHVRVGGGAASEAVGKVRTKLTLRLKEAPTSPRTRPSGPERSYKRRNPVSRQVCSSPILITVQGYLANSKTHPPITLSWTYA